MARATAAEVQKRFGTYSEIAQREAVTITNHGRDSLVLLSADSYARLKSLDTRRAYLTEDAPQELIDAIMTAEPPAWTDMYNHELDENNGTPGADTRPGHQVQLSVEPRGGSR